MSDIYTGDKVQHKTTKKKGKVQLKENGNYIVEIEPEQDPRYEEWAPKETILLISQLDELG